jgi:hypothetical protein
VTGVVVDAEGAPVSGARVVFEEVPGGDRFVTITQDQGAFAANLTLPSTAVSNPEQALPAQATLHQNFPNPFNPATVIRFALSQAAATRLIVYDVLGQRVKVLVDEWLTSGSHEANWDGTNEVRQGVAAGVYLYRLTTPTSEASRKMVLLDGAGRAGASYPMAARRPLLAPVARERVFQVRVTSGQIESHTVERFVAHDDAVLEIEVTRLRTEFFREDADGDGRSDLLTLLDGDHAQEIHARDLDLNGHLDSFLHRREELTASGALITSETQIAETADSVWVWSRTSVEAAGTEPAALGFRLRLSESVLGTLSMEDQEGFERQAGILVPQIVASDKGSLRLHLPEALTADALEIDYFGRPHIRVLESDPVIEWTYCNGSSCDHPYVRVAEPDTASGLELPFEFQVESSLPLGLDDMKLFVGSSEGETVELPLLLGEERVRRLNGTTVSEQTVSVNWQPRETGLYRLLLRIEREGVVLGESHVWHLQSRRPVLELDLIGGTRHLMVHVAAGLFVMGSDRGFTNERPRHRVELDGFYLDQTEVTNEQWNAYATFLGISLRTAPDDHPVVDVNWPEAAEYCRWAGLRLPTEAEWEKGARGADARTYPWGETISGNHANYIDSGDRFDNSTTPVGLFPAGAAPSGALDMAGNVWEWVADWFDERSYGSSPTSNPRGPSSGEGRVLRGGSWINLPLSLRTSHRGARDPVDRTNFIGFRCARDE